MTANLRSRVRGGESPDLVVPETIALASEACGRVTGEHPVAAQLIAAVAMRLGMVTDVKDGEGKSATLLLSATHAAIAGRGVHLVATNDRQA